MGLNNISLEGVLSYVRNNNIIGWQGEADMERLYHLASKCKGDVVELGAFMGLSTLILEAGICFGLNKSRLVTVDHFQGSSEHAGLGYTPQMIRDGFLKNIRDAKFTDCISVFEMDTVKAASYFTDVSVGLLLIDASHEYEAVKADFEAWYPQVYSGGSIVIHDAATWPGPKQVYEEMKKEGKIIDDLDWKNPVANLGCASFTIKP